MGNTFFLKGRKRQEGDRDCKMEGLQETPEKGHLLSVPLLLLAQVSLLEER